ncbi:hypothetical protein MJO29_009120 [Puccinia striiformis f. sp. tritici]|nr:hypothetical protein MJO29_009120 [Puccinia striiformis f. sp. tritici]
MFSTIYVACLLISAAAFASPVALEPRGFMQASSHDNSGSKSDANHMSSSQVGPMGMSTSQSDSASNAAYHNSGNQISGGSVGFGGVGGFNNGVGVGNGFANGGLVGGVGIQSQSYNAANSASTSTNNIGMNGGLVSGMQAQSYNAANSASMSGSSLNLGGVGGLGMGGVVGSAMNSFQTASQQIQQIQSTIQAGQFNAAMASQQMQSIAASMQSALSTANTCGGACFGPGAGQFGNTASSTISQFSSLINMMRSSFGNQFGGLISPFANLGTGLSQFFSQAQQSQSSSFQFSSNTMQQLVLPTLQSVIPGFQVPGLGF